ncbi:MAG: hypothetical protein JSR46_08670 [Verrucomicrobia bacterium]|nr:hypothetical protein [Verrucomicrobiota bacterium]
MSRFAPVIRFRPFSHLPGAHMLLPGSWLSAQVFPSKIVISDYSLAEPVVCAEIVLEGFGLLERFTVIQDLEQGYIQVSGFSKSGFLRYQIIPLEGNKNFSLKFTKIPSGGKYSLDTARTGKIDIEPLKTIQFLQQEGEPLSQKERERLFLGCTKAQDWSLVCRRMDIREILPVWYWLAQSIPTIDAEATLPQLEKLTHAVHERKMHELVQALTELFQLGFKDLLVPRLFDDSYLGLSTESTSCSPLLLLQKSWELIRECFFIELPGHLYILPNMPPQFHSGMLSRVVTKGGHTLTIEWTKQAVRRVWVEGGGSETMTFVFQKHLKHFRLRQGCATKTLPNCSEIVLEKGKQLLFDHFEK